MLPILQQPGILQKPLQKLSRSSEIVVHVTTGRLQLQDGKLQENHSLHEERRILKFEERGVL